MIDRSDTGLTVVLHGGDGSTWHVHGEGAGREGVRVGKDQMKGLWEAPVRTAWASGARQRGARHKGFWYEPRDMEIGFHIVPERVVGGDMETIMSKFWQAFRFEEDPYDWDARLPRIQVISAKSERWLDIQKRETTDYNPGTDPLRRMHANPILNLRAAQPFFYEPEEVFTWSTGTGSSTGVLKVKNPTPIPMYHKIILTLGDWTAPDRSIEGPEYHRFLGRSKRTGRDDSERDILMPTITELHGGAVIDLDPDELMVRDAHGTNLLGQMPIPGMWFEYEIPFHTQELELPISVTDAPLAGAMAQLVMPRLWPEPIGGQ